MTTKELIQHAAQQPLVYEETAPAPSAELNAHRARHTATIDAPLDVIPVHGLEFIVGSTAGLREGRLTNPGFVKETFVGFDDDYAEDPSEWSSPPETGSIQYEDGPYPDPRSDYRYGYMLVNWLDTSQGWYKFDLQSRAMVDAKDINNFPPGHAEWDNLYLTGPSGREYYRYGSEGRGIIETTGRIWTVIYGENTSPHRDSLALVNLDTGNIEVESIYTFDGSAGFTDDTSTPKGTVWVPKGDGDYRFMYLAGLGEDKWVIADWHPGDSTFTLVRVKSTSGNVGSKSQNQTMTPDPDSPGSFWTTDVNNLDVWHYDFDTDTFAEVLTAGTDFTNAKVVSLSYRKPDGAATGYLVLLVDSEANVRIFRTSDYTQVATVAHNMTVSFASLDDISHRHAEVERTRVGYYSLTSSTDIIAELTLATDGSAMLEECEVTNLAYFNLYGWGPHWESQVGTFFFLEGNTDEPPYMLVCTVTETALDFFTLGYWIQQVAQHFYGITVDASTLTDTLYGYQADDISFQRDLQAIREVFDFVIDDHDGAITCVRAADSGTPDVTLTLVDMIPDRDGVYVTTTVAEKDTLPHAVQIEFTDAESLYIRRHAEPAVLQHLTLAPNRIRKFSIPFAMIEKDVKALQWRLLWNLWAASKTFTMTVSAANMDITVGTVVQFPHDETSTYFSVGEVTAADMRADDTQVLTLKGVQIDKAIETTGSPIAFVSTAPLWANQASQYIHLDMPYQGTFAADLGGAGIVEYGVVTSANAYVWNGGNIYRSDDGGTTFVQIHSQTSSPFLGTVATPLTTGSPFAGLDDTTTLVIQMLAGSLSDLVDLSIGAAQSGTAKIAYGVPGRWEIIYAATMVHAGSGVVNVTNIYRGMEGSEWAAGQHVAGDFAILLNMSITADQEFDASFLTFDSDSEITTDLQYKATGTLQSPTAVSAVTRSITGMSHKSPAPHYLRATLISGGDITLEWLRRDRLTDDTDYADLVAPPLSEDVTEVPLVDLDILQADQSTVIRAKADTLASGTDPEYAITYTAAEISADGAAYAVGDEISFRVRHITTFDNAETLNGHWATVTVLIQAE